VAFTFARIKVISVAFLRPFARDSEDKRKSFVVRVRARAYHPFEILHQLALLHNIFIEIVDGLP
jgi:hypothetical protein